MIVDRNNDNKLRRFEYFTLMDLRKKISKNLFSFSRLKLVQFLYRN